MNRICLLFAVVAAILASTSAVAGGPRSDAQMLGRYWGWGWGPGRHAMNGCPPALGCAREDYGSWGSAPQKAMPAPVLSSGLKGGKTFDGGAVGQCEAFYRGTFEPAMPTAISPRQSYPQTREPAMREPAMREPASSPPEPAVPSATLPADAGPGFSTILAIPTPDAAGPVLLPRVSPGTNRVDPERLPPVRSATIPGFQQTNPNAFLLAP